MSSTPTIIDEEIKRITESGPKPVGYKYRLLINANGKTIEPFRLVNIDIIRDYFENYSDEIIAEFFIGAGTLHGDLIPNKDILTATLIKQQLKGISGEPDNNNPIQSFTYKASLIEGPSDQVQTATPDNLSKAGSDMGTPITVYLQLRERVVDALAKAFTGGIYYDEIPANVLRLMLGNESYLAGGDVRGVDLVPPSNTTPQKQLIIPQRVPVVDLPAYFQKHLGGVYSTGMGWYLQRGLWYLYPLADLTRFNKPHKSLTIINVAESKMPQIDRSYRETANQVIILCTGKVKSFDNSEATQINVGNGTRYTKAENVSGDFGSYLKNNTYRISRAKNNSEYYSMARRDGMQKAMVSEQVLITNPFEEMAQIALRECTYVMLEWQRSKEDLIYPGMPAKMVYQDNGEAKEIYGVVFKCQHFITGDSLSMIDTPHKTTSVVTLLVKKGL